jgi:hypothetical protein
MATADLARPALGCRRAETGTPVVPAAGVLHCATAGGRYDACMRSAVGVLGTLVLAVVVGGCTGSAAPSSPALSSPGPASPAATAAAALATASPAAPKTPKPTHAAGSPAAHSAGPAAAPTPVGVTRTPWGNILDAVPATFPVYPKATVADPPADHAVSGAWGSKASVAQVATWYRDALRRAAYAKVDLGSPLEDGSRVIDVQGDVPECKAQVTVRPLDGSTMITVLYGAGCAAQGG